MSEHALQEVDDLENALEVFELVEVVAYEHSGKRVPVNLDDDNGAPPQSEMEVLVRHSSNEIETRFRMTVTAPGMELASDVGVVYRSDNWILAPSLVPSFLEEIGIMAAYPYLREGTATSAVRLGLPAPTLGLLRRGQFTLQSESERVEEDGGELAD